MVENEAFLEVVYDWMDIFDIHIQRGRVGELNGIIFTIHSNEQGHNRGHLHAKYQNSEVVISIPEGEILGGNIPVSKQKIASKWVIEHKKFLINKWNELTNTVKIPIV